MIMMTALYASILALIYIKLSQNIISLRRKYKVSIGHSKHKDLEQAIRAQANFNEYVPIGLILLACLELNKIHSIVVFLLGGLLLVGRFLHAKAFLKDKIDVSNRALSIKFTFWSIRLMVAINIFALIVKLIY